MKALFREVLVTFILAIAIFLLIRTTVESFIIDGSSMEPNFQDRERLLINKVVYKFRQPERGEVIIFHPPLDPKKDYIKRVIGLPSESVEIKDGVVYIHKENGDVLPLVETYIITEPATLPFKSDIIPENEYFVLGDNRNNSYDSRNWIEHPTVPRENIVGKAWLSIWPPDEWGIVIHYPLQEQLASSGG